MQAKAIRNKSSHVRSSARTPLPTIHHAFGHAASPKPHPSILQIGPQNTIPQAQHSSAHHFSTQDRSIPSPQLTQTSSSSRRVAPVPSTSSQHPTNTPLPHDPHFPSASTLAEHTTQTEALPRNTTPGLYIPPVPRVFPLVCGACLDWTRL